ncbi:hypothetical protein ACLKA7_000342 [Drosophila subpalustris]
MQREADSELELDRRQSTWKWQMQQDVEDKEDMEDTGMWMGNMGNIGPHGNMATGQLGYMRQQSNSQA